VQGAEAQCHQRKRTFLMFKYHSREDIVKPSNSILFPYVDDVGLKPLVSTTASNLALRAIVISFPTEII
jgi:hypothetical protein